MPHDYFRILFVCTGNICRSPMAERFVRQAVASSTPSEAPQLLVESAGIRGFAGAPMVPHAATMIRERGGDPAGFRSRALTASMVDAADLVLTAERRHRAAVLSLDPRALHTCFTMLEFARLARHVDAAELATDSLAGRARSLTAAAASLRGQLPPGDPEDDDVADPYGDSPEAFHACAARLASGLDWLPILLTPQSDATRHA